MCGASGVSDMCQYLQSSHHEEDLNDRTGYNSTEQYVGRLTHMSMHTCRAIHVEAALTRDRTANGSQATFYQV